MVHPDDWFQSSPGPKAGRCEIRIDEFIDDPFTFQSSPGPKAGRCVHLMQVYTTWILFQSSPGPKAGRCPPGSALCSGSICFNPRPARRPGAAWRIAIALGSPIWFQSSPGPKAGRCLVRRFYCWACHRVSILARPEGRALPERRTPVANATTKFQSSPGPKAGRCQRPHPLLLAGEILVSILARPEGRALRQSDPAAT